MKPVSRQLTIISVIPVLLAIILSSPAYSADEILALDEASPTRALRKKLSPPPNIKSHSPARYIIAGETITFKGRNLRPRDFVAQLKLRKLITLPIVKSSDGRIVVQVPNNIVTKGSALIVRYKRGATKTLNSNYRVFPRPAITNLKIKNGPWIGVPSSIEMTISNFSGMENAEINLKSKSCWTLGTKGPKLPRRNRPTKIIFPITFRPGGAVSSLPGKTNTERLLALSGRKCFLELTIRRAGTMVTGKSVRLPRVSAKSISNTWQLTSFTTPSGKKLKIKTKGNLPTDCGPISVGTAGSFPIGVVKYRGDISFQLRNGIMNATCNFSTTPRLKTRPGWVITEVDWSIRKDQHCYAISNHTEKSPGSWGMGVPLNPVYLDRVRMNVSCVRDKKNAAKNSHLFRAVLKKITLIGPKGQPWKMAFK